MLRVKTVENGTHTLYQFFMNGTPLGVITVPERMKKDFEEVFIRPRVVTEEAISFIQEMITAMYDGGVCTCCGCAVDEEDHDDFCTTNDAVKVCRDLTMLEAVWPNIGK